jgi:hypothetical protein
LNNNKKTIKKSSNKNQKDHKKTPIKVAMSKKTCPSWHLGQVGQGAFGVPFD